MKKLNQVPTHSRLEQNYNNRNVGERRASPAYLDLYQRLGQTEMQLKSEENLADGEAVINWLKEKYVGE
jgi:hypothetical protein